LSRGYGGIEQLLAYAVDEEVATQSTSREGSGIESFLTDKVEGLATILRDIRCEIARRARVSHEVIARIYQQYLYLKTKLFELYRWPLSASRSIEQRRLGLEGMLDLLLREQRNEQVKCTEEIARLKGELWRWLKEYMELTVRVKFITA